MVQISGTILSGIFVMCCCCGHLAHTRFAAIDNGDNRCIAFLINMAIGVGQASTVILFLVGWCWSIGWGITMLAISSKYTTQLLSFTPIYSPIV